MLDAKNRANCLPICSFRDWILCPILVCALTSGCAALSNPTLQGVPVRRLPPELLAKPKDQLQTIPMPMLEQAPQETYRLAPGDILGIWIDGVLGDRNQVPPVHYQPTTIAVREQRRLPPGFGYP